MIYQTTGLSGQNTGQIVSVAGGTAGAGIAAATPILFGAAAGPIGVAVGAVVAGVSQIIGALIHPDYTKIKASQNADAIEQYMKANVNGYLQVNPPRPVSLQSEAVGNFDSLWAQFVQLESEPSLGTAGSRGIQERGRDGKPSWGKNWFELYRDPIANDAQVESGNGITDTLSAATGVDMGWILPVALVGVALTL